MCRWVQFVVEAFSGKLQLMRNVRLIHNGCGNQGQQIKSNEAYNVDIRKQTTMLEHLCDFTYNSRAAVLVDIINHFSFSRKVKTKCFDLVSSCDCFVIL